MPVTLRPPGDKSITHRALMMAALADGPSRIRGALTSLDARSMARVLRQLGPAVSALRPDRDVTVKGRGLRGWRAPASVLNCGNSGTTARFLLGALASFAFRAVITGDASLRRRPMRRVTRPLTTMGARFEEGHGDGLPIVVRGGPLTELDYDLPVAAAQVKTALLLAGLTGRVAVRLHEPGRSRDHTERMLRGLAVPLVVSGGRIALAPVDRLRPFELDVPGDISSAAFLIGAALLDVGDGVLLKGVGVNPTRTGALRVLERMGARFDIRSRGEPLGEPVADIAALPSPLAACRVAAEEVPSLIDEVPMLAVLASRAAGESVFQGVHELRVKESDRLALIAENLRAVGVEAEASDATLTVIGTDRPPRGRVNTAGDHRLTMAFAVLGALPGARVRLSETASAAVSYPTFFADLRELSRGG
ncbi:MAG: 3-phosphoshikimate 1-carboxyvinyltransferase [Gemmatimonadetes bacterium RBG_16_66_8]|nr:MAG: 3-phosphoshikimate 1-carboxyvinyltransferase [Gemmatimonadetes bacterium RBG_16_66_8]